MISTRPSPGPRFDVVGDAASALTPIMDVRKVNLVSVTIDIVLVMGKLSLFRGTTELKVPSP